MSSVPEPSQPAADKPPWVRLVKGQQVSLSWGTLILIALIVLVSVRVGTGNLTDQVRGLRAEIGHLKMAVQAETVRIRALQDKLDKAKGKE